MAKDKINKSFIVILTLLISLFFFVSSCSNEKKVDDKVINYNGYYFAKIDNFWTVKINKTPYIYISHLRYNPRELKDIPLLGNLSDFLPSNKTYISFYPKENNANVNLALAELAVTLAESFIVIQNTTFNPKIVCASDLDPSCTAPDENNESLPIMNCTTSDKTIVFEESNTTRIIVNETCIHVFSTDDDMIRSSERLLYSLYGIMK